MHQCPRHMHFTEDYLTYTLFSRLSGIYTFLKIIRHMHVSEDYRTYTRFWSLSGIYTFLKIIWVQVLPQWLDNMWCSEDYLAYTRFWRLSKWKSYRSDSITCGACPNDLVGLDDEGYANDQSCNQSLPTQCWEPCSPGTYSIGEMV
jgi:hypothetical protein